MAKVRIEVDDDGAEAKLKAVQRSLEETSKEFDDAQRSASRAPRRAQRQQSQGVSPAAKAAMALAAVAIAAKVVESVTQILSQELERRGFDFFAEQLDEISKGITQATSLADKIRSALGTVDNVARPFAEAGSPLGAEALLGSARIGWARAQREAEAERRRTGRNARFYADTAAKIAQQLF